MHECRPLQFRRDHVEGDNWDVIRICLEGRGNYDFTDKQIAKVGDMVLELSEFYEKKLPINVHSQGKTCPLAKNETFESFSARVVEYLLTIMGG